MSTEEYNANDWAKKGKEFALLIAIGTFMAIINPYNAMRDLPFWGGWLYWTGIIIYGSLIADLVSDKIIARFEGRPVLITVLIATITALAITPVLTFVHYLLGQSNALRLAPYLFVLVWVISAGLSAIGVLRHNLEKKDEQLSRQAETQKDPLEQFTSRLPVPYRTAELYALSSEDHYLRAHTSAGEHLFLERLATAVHQLDGAKGLQTHRSWWVAENGVKETKSENGRIVLTLKSGAEAPVSRTFAKAVKDAGWV